MQSKDYDRQARQDDPASVLTIFLDPANVRRESVVRSNQCHPTCYDKERNVTWVLMLVHSPKAVRCARVLIRLSRSDRASKADPQNRSMGSNSRLACLNCASSQPASGSVSNPSDSRYMNRNPHNSIVATHSEQDAPDSTPAEAP